MSATTTDHPSAMSASRRIIITAALMVAMFLAAVEATIVNAAMPTVVSALGGLSLYSWVFSAFMLANTTTVPIYGKLADLYGRKRVFIIAVLLFIGGSALCGLSRSMEQLVFFRIIQGLGAGGVMPVALTIVGDIYPFEQRARIQGWFSSVWGLAALIGPFVGGWTIDHFSWRWIFWFNLPFGLFVISIIIAFLPNRKADKRLRIDIVGALLLMVSVFTFLFATQQVGSLGWNAPAVWLLLILAALLLTAFILWERRESQPFLPVELFKNRIIYSSNLTAFLTGIGMFGAISFVPLFVQSVLGKSATLAGLAITPQVLGWSTASVVAGRWMLRSGYRPPILAGVSLISSAAALFIWMDAETPYLLVLGSMFVLGLGLGLSMTTYIVAVQNAVDTDRRGAATSSQMFARTLGGAVGVTILGAVMISQLRKHIDSFLADRQGQLDPETIRQLQEAQGITHPEGLATLPPSVADQVSQFLALSLDTTFFTAAALSVLTLASAYFLIPGGSAQSLAAEKD
jgi:EmrB/QacA subfamily drug resistance transporter